ncbi:MAG: ABC transporter permease [Mycoplasmoidaceae bacterium]
MNKKKFTWNKNFNKLIPFSILLLFFLIIPSIILIVLSLSPNVDSDGSNIPMEDNWNWLGTTVWEKILISIGIAIAVTILCVLIGMPFGLFLSQINSSIFKTLIVIVLTMPMWLSMLIKIIGIKTFFDTSNEMPNSTFGHIYTIITLVYLNLPIFILSILNIAETMPKNLLLASKDLGRNSFQTLIYVVIPYILPGLLMGMFLVFLPSLTATGITSFVNNSNDGGLIGDWIFDLGLDSSSSNIALARISSISIVMSLIIMGMYLLFYFIPKRVVKFIGGRKNV